MKNKLFAGALALLALAGAATPAAADDFRRGERHDGRGYDNEWSGHRRNVITIRDDGRSFSVVPSDRLFYRLLDRPFGFRPGYTYAYTDRCNRYGCVAFVFDGWSRRPIDRIFAPHLPMRGYAWREARDFDRFYRGYGDYDHDDRGWNNDDDRMFREDRDGRGERNWQGGDDRRGTRGSPEHGGLRAPGELEGGNYR